MEQKTTKCIIMSRVSTTMQELDIQEEECMNMALADGYTKENMILIPRLGESARKVGEVITVDTPRGTIEVELDRDGIWDMKKQIESNADIDCVYIWEVSRLARRMDILTPLLKYFADKKIQLRIKTSGIEYLNADKTVNAAAKMTIEILGEVAEQEMNVKIERFKRSKRVLAEQGKYAGGKIPYGYEIDKEHGNVYVIKEDEAQIIREIYNLYEAGITQPNIAREFYRRGAVDVNLSRVNHILTNEFYTGCWHKNGWSSYERAYPAIITKEQYNRCRKIADTNNTFANKCRSIYYSLKLIKCTCGRTWGAGPSKVFYRCYDAHRVIHNDDYVYHPQCTNRMSISLNIMDSILWKLAQEAEVNYIVHTAKEDKAKYDARIAILNEKLSFIDSRLAQTDSKKERIAESYIDGAIDKSKRDAKYREVDEERRAILQEQSSYMSEREHIISLLSDVEARFNMDNNIESMEDAIAAIVSITDKVNSISDDQTRYDIVHKHIKEVTVENQVISHTFSIVGTKLVKARYITVRFYNGDTRYFYYLPFSGGKNTVKEVDADGEDLGDLQYTYYERFFDARKKAKNEEKKVAYRENLNSRFPQEEYAFGYEGLKDFLGIKIKMTYSLVKRYLYPAKENINGTSVAFNKSKCIEILKDVALTDKRIKRIYDEIPCANKLL